MVKAAAGGGGRGMRVAHNDISLTQAVRQGRTEAEAAFKDGRVYQLHRRLQGHPHSPSRSEPLAEELLRYKAEVDPWQERVRRYSGLIPYCGRCLCVCPTPGASV